MIIKCTIFEYAKVQKVQSFRSLTLQERIVLENRDWVVLVPFWAVWPYETMLLPKKQISRMQDLTESQQESLAVAMKRLCTKYDNLFSCSFPYSMGWHGIRSFILSIY